MTLPSLPSYRSPDWLPYITAVDSILRGGGTGVGLTTENVQDIVAGMITPGTGISTSYDDSAGSLLITNTGGAGSAGGIAAVAATKTTSTTLTVSQHNPVDASGGNRLMPLPAADVALEISIEKVDSSPNTVTVSGPIRGSGTSTVVLSYQYDRVRLSGKSDGTWWPTAAGQSPAGRDAAIRSILSTDSANPDSQLNANLNLYYLTLQSATDFGLAPFDSFKPADTSRTSTATATADPDLLLAMDPNVAYRVRAVLFFQSDATADFKAKWSVPAGTTMRWSMNGPSTAASAGTVGSSQWDVLNETGTAACGGLGATQPVRAVIDGIIDTGSVGGTLKFLWAQNSSVATATTLLAGSSISLTRVGFNGSLTGGGGTITLPYSQTFSTGTSWPSEWTTTGNATVDSTAGVGKLATSSTALTASTAYLSGMADTADIDVTTDYTTPATLADMYVAIGGRGNGTFTVAASNAGYWAELRPFSSGGYVGLYRANSAGSGTALVTDVPFTWAASTTYHLRFQCIGSTIRVRIWTGATEPTTWTATATDATYASGKTFLSVTNATAFVRTATFDNYGVASPSSGIDTPASFSNLSQFQLEGNTVKIQDPPITTSPWVFSAVTDSLSRTGATYSRHELRDGDRWTDGRERCELRWLTHDTVGGYLPFNTNVWVSYAFRWSGALPTGDYNIITQMNMELSQAPEETLTTRHAAVFSLNLQPAAQGGLQASFRGDTNFVGTTDPGLTPAWTAGSVPPANTWQYMVYRMKFSKASATGELDIYYNGSAVYSSTGLVNAYNDNTGPYLKMGQYRGYGSGFSGTHETTVIELANHECSLSSLLGRVTTPLALPNLP